MKGMSNRAIVRTTPSRSRGFSLLEMVIVLGIIALILATAVGLSTGFMELARIKTTKAQISHVKTKLMGYQLLAGHYPSEQQGLRALVERPGTAPVPRSWQRFLDRVPLDGWKRDFEYRYPGTRRQAEPEVISRGGDGELGSDDDLSSADAS